MNGFSSGISPIKIDLKMLQIKKFINPQFKSKDFHENESELLKFMYYDNEFNKPANLANLTIIQQKIKKLIETQFNMLELLQKRTKTI